MPAPLSIVIPAYNASRFIRQAVDSALAQAPAAEVIVVDDGSQDDTASCVSAIDSCRVRLVHQENAGPAAARNHGASIATGELIGFLDADDQLEPGWADAVVKEAHDGAAISVTDAEVVDDRSGRSVGRYYEQLNFPPPKLQPMRIVEENFVLSTACVPRAVFERLGGFDEGLKGCEDWDLWIRIILDDGRASLVPHPLSRYRRGHQSLSSDVNSMIREELRMLEKVRQSDLAPTLESRRAAAARVRRGRLEVMEADQAAVTGHRTSAVGYLRASVELRQARLAAKALVALASPSTLARRMEARNR